MKFRPTEKRILGLLAESSEGLLAFTVYKRLNVSVSEFYLAVKSLQSYEMVVFENEEKLSLTGKGVSALTTLSRRNSERTDPFGTIPEDFKGPRIGIDELYLPKADLFD